MPIVFISENSAVATDDLNTKMIVRFKVTNAENQPVSMANVHVELVYNYMIISNHSPQTDCDGEGEVELVAIPGIGNYDILKIVVAGQSTSRPVVLYNPTKNSEVLVDEAVLIDDEYYLTREQLLAGGLSIQVDLSELATTKDYAFLIINSYIQFRIPLSPSTNFNFYLPPESLQDYDIDLGKYKIFYGLHSESGNNHVPDYTVLNITYSQADQALSPLLVESIAGQYINIVANLSGVKLTIPGDQPLLQDGALWEMYYTLQSPDNSRTTIASGVVNAINEIEYTTPPDYFPAMENTLIFFSYKIISPPDAIEHQAPAVELILDTASS